MEQTSTGGVIRDDHDLISPTAYLVADWRSYSDIKNAKRIAEALRAGPIIEEIIGGENEKMMSWFGAPMVEARDKVIRQQIAKIGCKNILGLAEGVLPNGYNLTEDPEVRYVHSDLPQMLSEAEAVLRGLMVEDNARRPNLRFMAVNALDERQLKDATYFFNEQPFVGNCQGLVMYFEPAERRKFWQTLNEFMRENEGEAFVTSDISYKGGVKSLIELLPNYAPKVLEAMQILNKKTKRNIRENFYTNPDEAHKELDETGWEWTRGPMYDGKTDIVSLNRAPEDMKEALKEFLSQRFVYTLTPKK